MNAHGECPDHGHTCHGEDDDQSPCTLNSSEHLYGPLDVCVHCGEPRPGTRTAAAVARAEYERAQTGYTWGLCSVCGEPNKPAFIASEAGELFAVAPHEHDRAERGGVGCHRPWTPALTLSEFLLARITEDEADARACKEWSDCFACPTHETFDTGRVLAECEAKRRIVEFAMPNETNAPRTERGRILRILASVYADHQDFNEAWLA